jgi:hypothetical protein
MALIALVAASWHIPRMEQEEWPALSQGPTACYQEFPHLRSSACLTISGCTEKYPVDYASALVSLLPAFRTWYSANVSELSRRTWSNARAWMATSKRLFETDADALGQPLMFWACVI